MTSAGGNLIRFEENRILVEYSYVLSKDSNGYFVNLSAFNMFYHSDSSDKAKEEAKYSIRSFFKYWLTRYSLPELKNYLTSKLGFQENSDVFSKRGSDPSTGSQLMEPSGTYGVEVITETEVITT